MVSGARGRRRNTAFLISSSRQISLSLFLSLLCCFLVLFLSFLQISVLSFDEKKNQRPLCLFLLLSFAGEGRWEYVCVCVRVDLCFYHSLF